MKRFFVVATMLRGAIDPELVDADTEKRLVEIQRIEAEIHLPRIHPREVFPESCGKSRSGLDGVPTWISPAERCAS